MSKKKFEGWRWDCINAEVEYNLPRNVVLYFTGPIAPKKNSRQNFGRISLPSTNYIEWHKRIMEKLKGKEWKYNGKPCTISIYSIVGDRVKSDCDNQVSSIMDTLVDLGIIEDDNRFIVKAIDVKNLGYIKNCWIHRIEIKPYELPDYDISDNHKGKNLLEYKDYVNCYFKC